jgi:thiol-disulfide isomerase/thioredoxin
MRKKMKAATFRTALLAGLLGAAGLFAQNPETAVWLDRPQEAWNRAQAENKLVLIDFYADWCGWCKVMEKESFAQPAFLELTRDLVLLRVDIEKLEEGKQLGRRYQADNLPLLVLASSRGQEIARLEGYLPTSRLLSRLQRELNRYRQARQGIEKALASDQPPVWEQGLRSALDLGDGDRAWTLVNRLRSQSGLEPLKLGWLDLLAADALRLLGRYSEAKAEVQKALERSSVREHDQLSEQANWLQYAIARDEGNCRAARAVLETWAAQKPASARLYQAQKELERLERSVAKCS